jgi:hypothetical protein
MRAAEYIACAENINPPRHAGNAMSRDRRVAPRVNVRWRAQINDSGGSSLAQCQVQDISASGAKLLLRTATELPDAFSLVLSKNGVQRHCELVWFTDRTVSVRFLQSSSTEKKTSHIAEVLTRMGFKPEDVAREG